MDMRRVMTSIALVGLVWLGGLGCTSEADKGVPVEKTKRATVEETKGTTIVEATARTAERTGERTKPMASGFANPAQACAFVLSSKEFRPDRNPDVVAECREDYGVTLENAAEKLPKEAAKDQKDG
jgi:hypothetical protein